MPVYEVHGPDPVREYWLVEIEVMGAVTTETSLAQSYRTKVAAQAAADLLNADLTSASPA
ncbi:MAG: hypothetical protein A3E77_01670 [Sphingopyxis sp. RIFCSPHIGHO2_12_FULL_65_19]|nr:MAG: hypothetical protein A3E77_01670 [Sphingopyxis sp. RIFCSPHIGHO2_12_FULL_65_19]